MRLKETDTPPILDWSARFDVLSGQAKNAQLRRFYQGGVVSAMTPVERVQLLAMDIETTGLDVQAHSIVSIGLIPLTLERIHCNQSMYWVLKPSSELVEKSVTFHHITHAEISNAPRFSEVRDALLEAMTGKVMVVHYRNIERGFLDQALRKSLGEGIEFPVIDTMQLEARVYRKKLSWLDRLLRRKQASIRLADSRERLNLPAYHAHHALIDALGTAELLQAQIANRYSRATPIGELWS
ncbi:3'-5' exonuclease [Pseudomonas sp. SIMBA_077]